MGVVERLMRDSFKDDERSLKCKWLERGRGVVDMLVRDSFMDDERWLQGW